MRNPLTMKLEQFTHFSGAERRWLDDLLHYPTKSYARGDTIIGDGAKVGEIYLVLTGLAARSKTLAGGNRQMMAFLVPGDLCDIEVFVLQAMDHDIIALTDTTCLLIPAIAMEELLTQSSNITRAMWWSTMTDSAVLREWIVGHGSRDSRERIAHLFFELLIRYRVIGEAADDTIPFPLTQGELADATGITQVHVNRIVGQLRSEGLIQIESKTLTVLDVERLREAARYDTSYLHLTRTEQGDPEVSGRVGDLIDATATG
jgi:CRP-like cAMP-binding protein